VLHVDELKLLLKDIIELHDIVLVSLSVRDISLSGDMIESQSLSPSKNADMGDLNGKPDSLQTLLGNPALGVIEALLLGVIEALLLGVIEALLPALGVMEDLCSKLVTLPSGDSASNVLDRLHSLSPK